MDGCYAMQKYHIIPVRVRPKTGFQLCGACWTLVSIVGAFREFSARLFPPFFFWLARFERIVRYVCRTVPSLKEGEYGDLARRGPCIALHLFGSGC